MVEVVAALIRDASRVLICQRSKKQSRALKWEFPGGKIEPGETPEDALKRECKEELAIDISVGKRIAENEFSYPDIMIHLSLYEAAIIHGIPVALEHAECRFADVETLSELPFCPADVPFVLLITNRFPLES